MITYICKCYGNLDVPVPQNLRDHRIHQWNHYNLPWWVYKCGAQVYPKSWQIIQGNNWKARPTGRQKLCTFLLMMTFSGQRTQCEYKTKQFQREEYHQIWKMKHINMLSISVSEQVNLVIWVSSQKKCGIPSSVLKDRYNTPGLFTRAFIMLTNIENITRKRQRHEIMMIWYLRWWQIAT
jgi:hypothetical protein